MSTHSLLQVLSETIVLLEKYDVPHWAQWFRKDTQTFSASPRDTVEHILKAFGGMGSFNDLYICSENGHSVSKAEEPAANRELQRLRDEIYKLSTNLRSQ